MGRLSLQTVFGLPTPAILMLYCCLICKAGSTIRPTTDINNGRRMLVLPSILYSTSKLIQLASISTSQDALAFAYLYGFPLYAYALYVKAFSNPQVNVAYPFRNLATPEDHVVVRPNVDTLYTPLFYDLSQGDLEFVIPEFDDRYWLWPWYDLYGNNFGNIGAFYHSQRNHA